jgi:hypothetical protein
MQSRPRRKEKAVEYVFAAFALLGAFLTLDNQQSLCGTKGSRLPARTAAFIRFQKEWWHTRIPSVLALLALV